MVGKTYTMKYYNHAYDLAFEVFSTNPDGEATTAEILEGLKRRVAYLEANPDQLKEACGCYDTMEEEYTQEDYENWKALK